MRNDAKIYAKQQQIKLIDNILCNLCSIELNSDGRKYIKKMKEKLRKEVDRLKQLEDEQTEDYNTMNPLSGFRFQLTDSLRFLK